LVYKPPYLVHLALALGSGSGSYGSGNWHPATAIVSNISDLCKQLVWILALLTQLNFPQRTVPVYEDNQPALDSLIANRNSQRTRHYEIRYFWVRELMDERKIIKLIKVHTTQNYADYWTKILPKTEMQLAIQSFMFKPLHESFRPKDEQE
jgi:hypothetical protein